MKARSTLRDTRSIKGEGIEIDINKNCELLVQNQKVNKLYKFYERRKKNRNDSKAILFENLRIEQNSSQILIFIEIVITVALSVAYFIKCGTISEEKIFYFFDEFFFFLI